MTENNKNKIEYSRIPPQAVDIERCVLGALLIDRDAFDKVSDRLRPESFYDARHQIIYGVIQSMKIENKPVDLFTIHEELERQKKLDKAGGIIYLNDLNNRIASSYDIEYHCRVVVQKAMARDLIRVATDAINKAYDDSDAIDDTLERAEEDLYQLGMAIASRGRGYGQMDTYLLEADRLLKLAAQTDGITGVPTGYDQLDKITSGWQKSDLIILAGRPAMGKTSFAISLTKKMVVDRKIPVAFFTLEMSSVQLVNKLKSNVCQIDSTHLVSGQLSQDEWFRHDKKKEKLTGLPLYIDMTPGLTVLELKAKARRLVRDKGIRLIIIDYLQLMNGVDRKYSSREQEVSNISRSLKALATELDIPIIALSQLNRNVANREGILDKRPQLSDLRESGAIEQDADMVLFVHRPEYFHIYQDDEGKDLHGKALIIIEKHRKGAVGEIKLDFKPEYSSFEDPLEPKPFIEGELFESGLKTK